MAVVRILAAPVGGVVALALLFPFAGADTLPPVCYSVFGYSVPCGAQLSLAVAVVTTVVVAVALLLARRRS